MFFLSKYRYLTMGLAMFSMFFGAGNVIFPLIIGQVTGEQVPYALLGLLLTAVGIPFIGLITMILFQGDYNHFFARFSTSLGLILMWLIMLLLGPFGAIPRCIALSYSTCKTILPNLPSPLFSGFACLIIFLCSLRKSQILNLLSYILTPLLLLSLGFILIKGFFAPGTLQASLLSNGQSFTYGLIEGYNTMDLLAAFFFSTVIFEGLKLSFDSTEKDRDKKIFFLALKASAIGAMLLSIVYVGFSFLAARHSADITATSPDLLLGALITKILGAQAGIFTSLIIALACLTTAIALAATLSEFLQKTLFRHRISYIQALLLTLSITYGVSILEFNGIAALLTPILQFAYPVLIVLTLFNLFYQLYRFKPTYSELTVNETLCVNSFDNKNKVQ